MDDVPGHVEAGLNLVNWNKLRPAQLTVLRAHDVPVLDRRTERRVQFAFRLALLAFRLLLSRVLSELVQATRWVRLLFLGQVIHSTAQVD